MEPTATMANNTQREPATPEAVFRGVIRLYGLIRRVMDPYFSRVGISGAQWGVLRALLRAETEGGRAGVRLTDLSERLLVRPPSVTSIVDRLVRLGLVARRTSSGDLRERHVKLTPAGRQLMRRVQAGHRKRIAGIMGGLSPAELAELSLLVERLGAHLEAISRQPDRLSG
jgi:DNA-binding MarR family transcriptional regulator